jgi:uncharacterized protein YkuJ
LLSSNKIAFWREYYANIIVYNYKTDVCKKLFEKDVFIEGIRNDNYYNLHNNVKINNLTQNWVFLFVKLNNTNKDKRVDENDPSVLFAVSTDGERLKQLNEENENVTGLENFERQGFVLIRIQKDSDGNQSFTAADKEFYYKKINLADLSSGNNIEIK